MSNETNDVDIRKLYMQMKDELRHVVYSAVVIGGIFGVATALAITSLTIEGRLGIIILGCVFGYYLGKLRKQDLYEKSLLTYCFLDLLPKTKTEEPKVKESDEPQKDVVVEESAVVTVEAVTPAALETSIPPVAVVEPPAATAPAPTPEAVKPEIKTVVKKVKGKPVKLP